MGCSGGVGGGGDGEVEKGEGGGMGGRLVIYQRREGDKRAETERMGLDAENQGGTVVSLQPCDLAKNTSTSH